MSSDFFYKLASEQFALAYDSFHKKTSAINTTLGSAFTITTIIMGLCYFVFENSLDTRIFFYVKLSFISLILVVGIGSYTTFPNNIMLVNPAKAFNNYFDYNATIKEEKEAVAIIAKTLSNDVNTLRGLISLRSERLFYMQAFMLAGLFNLGLMIMEILGV